MTVCGECGVSNPDDYRFCAECGAALGATLSTSTLGDPAPGFACAACGTVNPADFAFCMECGQSLPVRPEPAGDEGVSVDPSGCAACGTVNPADFAFCMECGQSLAAGPAVATEEPEPIQLAVVPATVSEAATPTLEQVPSPVEERVGAPGPTMPPITKPAHVPVHQVRPARRGTSRRRWRWAAAAAVVVIAGSAGTAAILSHDSGERSAGGGGGDVLMAPADITSAAGLDSIDDRPNEGFGVVSGSVDYRFEGFVWQARAHDPESGRTSISRTGHRVALFDAGGGFRYLGSGDDQGWADAVLARTPGVGGGPGSWSLDEPTRFAPSLDEPPDGGIWGIDEREGTVFLFRDTTTRYVFARTGDGFAWVLDEVQDALFLMTPGADGMLGAAGVVVPAAGGYRYVSSGTHGGDPAVEDRALGDLRGSAPFVAMPGEMVVVPASASASSRLAQQDFASYFSQPSGPALTHPGGSLQGGWAMVGHDPDVILPPAAAIPPNPDFTDAEPVFVGTDLGFDHLFDEVACVAWSGGTPFSPVPGPGSQPDGGGAPGFAQSYLTAIGSPTVDQQMAMHTLARAWMPWITLSDQEKCGQITRLVATVYPYDEWSQPTVDLRSAARVEIVYTVFYIGDGGRFSQAAHAGDNEGFVVGLVRSTRIDGRCGLSQPNFELVMARSSAHANVSVLGIPLDWIPGTEGVLAKTHDQMRYSATQCPAVPPSWGAAAPVVYPPQSGGYEGYSVYSAENKHATYFRVDACEAAMMGMEECSRQGDRRPYDLSSWVELFVTDSSVPKTAWCSDGRWSSSAPVWPPPGQSYEHGTSYADFACEVRGDLWRDPMSQLPGEYQLPNEFFEIPTAPVPPPLDIEPDTPNIPRPEQVLVPDLIGLDDREAERAAADAGMSLLWLLPPADLPAGDPRDGTVVDQSPVADTVVNPGEIIMVRIGQAADEVAVPDVRGLDADAARRRIEGVGLQYRQGTGVELAVGDGRDGQVVEQDPPGGRRVSPGSTVTVQLGRTPTLVEVPDLGGIDSDEARYRLEQVGLEMAVIGVEVDPTWVGRVIDQDPWVGEMVEAGSVVTVTVGIPMAVTPDVCDGLEPTIIGTQGDDAIYGTAGDDVIVGLGGDDVILGLQGDDVVCGGPGNDEIWGGIGFDRLFGEDGDDELSDADDGTMHQDLMDGGPGYDYGVGNSSDVCSTIEVEVGCVVR